MYTVKLFRKAEIELNEACEWYDDKAAGLGAKFLSVIDLKLKLIEKQPLYYNVRFSEKYRVATINDYPYFIVYRIDDQRKIIFVISIFHTSRNPAKF